MFASVPSKSDYHMIWTRTRSRFTHQFSCILSTYPARNLYHITEFHVWFKRDLWNDRGQNESLLTVFTGYFVSGSFHTLSHLCLYIFLSIQDGLTPLHLAVQEDKVPVAECLLNAAAPIDAATHEAGFTPLHTAAYRGQLASVRLLLTRLGELGRTEAVNARTTLGSTPLHLAAQQGHLQVALKLLQSGADPNARNRVS